MTSKSGGPKNEPEWLTSLPQENLQLVSGLLYRLTSVALRLEEAGRHSTSTRLELPLTPSISAVREVWGDQLTHANTMATLWEERAATLQQMINMVDDAG